MRHNLRTLDVKGVKDRLACAKTPAAREASSWVEPRTLLTQCSTLADDRERARGDLTRSEHNGGTGGKSLAQQWVYKVPRTEAEEGALLLRMSHLLRSSLQ